MEIRGRVQNGVVVLEGELAMLEGAIVTISYQSVPPPESPDTHRPDRFPPVRSDRPGTCRLTAERLVEILEDEDVSASQSPAPMGPQG